MSKNLITTVTPEFIEEEYISAVETHLNLCEFRGGQISIHRVSQDKERELGYDGVMNSIVPMYIQFKRSYFCTNHFNGQTKKDREALRLNCNKGFYEVNLHKDKKTLGFEQHNALWKLSKSHTAVYVAPLFYKRTGIDKLRHFFSKLPWVYQNIYINDSHLVARLKHHGVRLFHHSVTIPPHREITDISPSHKYTVDTDLGICFHSEPELPNREGRLLDDLLDELTSEALISDMRPEVVVNNLMKYLPELYETSWEDSSFTEIIKTYLTELDLPTNEILSLEQILEFTQFGRHLIMSDNAHRGKSWLRIKNAEIVARSALNSENRYWN